MKNDISKASFDELNHFVGVFNQMGRMPLDADLNEQNELVLRLMQRLAGDAIHTGSANDGFRVDTHVVLDRMESRRGWIPTPATAALFVDYFDHRVGDGSLVAIGATAIAKTLGKPIDLTDLREVVIAVKAVPAAGLTFYVKDAAATVAFTMSDVATDDGWLLVRGEPGAWPAGFAADRIVEYGFTGLSAATRYNFDRLQAGLPMREAIVRTGRIDRYSAQPLTGVLSVDDDVRIGRSDAIRAEQATSVSFALPAPVDASRARALRVAIVRLPAAAPFAITLTDDATPPNTLTLASAASTTSGAWEIVDYPVPQGGAFDWSAVTQLAYTTLDATASYRFGPVLLEADPGLDLVVMGGDGTSAGAGRFHGDGLAAVKEAHGTYFTQVDLPQANPAALDPVAEMHERIDWAYLDLWERPLSYVERPALREIALEGVDTCTRAQLVAQVRLLKGVEVPLGNGPVPPSDAFETLPGIGDGVLSTKDKTAAVLDPCADPCEPRIAGPYVGEENRLFRVEIHRAGELGDAADTATAWFKWSRDNAGVMCALIGDALTGATSALVEKPELFAVGDLIEIADDLVELVTGPCEDRVDHRRHTRGELRRVSTVNLQARRIGWADATVVDPLEIALHAALPRSMLTACHAKLTRWDGRGPCTVGDIVLADGVVIEFGGAALGAGDYWLFTTRTIDRSVERLIEAPPRGIRHRYYPLAAIHRSRLAAPAAEVVFADDLRPRYAALPALDASRVAYDPGAGLADTPVVPGWAEVETVQEAIDALVAADLTGDLRLHNKLLHGMGVICGLKLRCARDRLQIVMGKGYALSCEGDLLHVGGEVSIPIVRMATDQGLLDGKGNGRVNLWIEQGAGGVVPRIEPGAPENFWSSILEGTLLKDFFDDYVLSLVNFVKAQLLPFPATTLPLPDTHKRVIALINLVWQKVNAASGPYVFVSKAEHDLLEQLHSDLQDRLAGKTFCAMFDNLTVFPPYPYAVPTGIDTMFGLAVMHRRIKVDPTDTFAVSCGVGRRLQFFHLATRTAVLVTDFPGGTNLDVQDVAFNAAGTELYAVGTLTSGADVDSVCATATITLPVAPATLPKVAWGPTSVVCDIRFVTLRTHALRPGTLFAVGQSATDPTKRGIYSFNPAAVPLAPSPIGGVAFNATGLFAIDVDGVTAVATEQTGGSQAGDFNSLRALRLDTGAMTAAFAATGATLVDDLALNRGRVYLTASPGGVASLLRFTLAPIAALPPLPLGSSTLWRLGLLPARNTLAISGTDTYRMQFFDTTAGVLKTNFRIPLQVMPVSVTTNGPGTEIYALNMFSGTVSAIDVAKVTTLPMATFTDEPPGTLAAYRQQMLDSFTDLGGVLVQYFKDGWCDEFLVECPDCDRQDKIYLGTIEIQWNELLKESRVFHICNFSKRHYAKSFRTWSYWLSAVPVLPLVKKLFAKFCCLTLVH